MSRIPLTPRRARIAGLVAAGGLLAAWLAPARTPVTPAPGRAPAPSDQGERLAPVTPVLADLHAETARLAIRIRAPARAREPERNPFRFSGTRQAPMSARRIPAETPRPGPVTSTSVSVPPPFRLIGIAEADTPAGPVRVGILSAPDALHLVREGDRVGERFRVGRIAMDALEITDVRGATTTTLGLRERRRPPIAPPGSRLDRSTGYTGVGLGRDPARDRTRETRV